MELGKGSSIHYLDSCFSSIEVEDQPFLSLATIEGNSNNETMKIKYPLSKKKSQYMEALTRGHFLYLIRHGSMK